VLSFESEAPLPGLKKKRLLAYTIDLQYCMFCALCVEICPTDSLYFSHQFELTCARRGDIRAVYHRPPELDEKEREEAERTARAREAPGEEAAPAADEAKRRKQVEAVKAALVKNPARALGRVLEDENDIALMAAVLAADEKKAATVAAQLVEDPDKARKVVAGLLAREKKARPREGGGGQ
jgi:NADH-quinone oxidoreductase subunit I